MYDACQDIAPHTWLLKMLRHFRSSTPILTQMRACASETRDAKVLSTSTHRLSSTNYTVFVLLLFSFDFFVTAKAFSKALEPARRLAKQKHEGS